MTARRRAGAPRLIEWTGERCVPWAPDVQVIYEHLHRYLWAARVVAGLRVLDLGSGEGFGSAILAETAAVVVGLDIDERTVEHSRLNYAGEGGSLEFVVGTATDLSAFGDASFDVVVAFEVIEHLREQEKMIAGIARVLAPSGVLMLSTPERRLYSEATGYENPFHERELTLEELTTVLHGSFANTALWAQQSISGSELVAIDGPGEPAEGPGVPPFFVERSGDSWTRVAAPAPRYLVAAAANGELPDLGSHSTLADCGLELMRKAERDAAERLTDAAEGLQVAWDHTAAAEANIADLQAQLVDAHRRLHEMHQTAEVDLARLRSGVEAERGNSGSLRAQLLAKGDELALVDRERAAAVEQLARIQESVSWRAFQRSRARTHAVLGGRGSPASRLLSATLRVAGILASPRRHTEVAAAAPDPEPIPAAPSAEEIELPEFASPKVSLVIPLHSGAALTRACLESVRDNTDGVSYEVILVDDDADAETKELLAAVKGATIVVNEENLGYLRTVNRGASFARGRWLVLCNNDIVVAPGWLSTLVACGESAPDVAVVTPKYVYPDGLLCEAGGIIWRDGTGGNYGRGDDPWLAAYNYRREVDYGSAAALLVRADVFAELGGYDERFVPMYYEDTDLCFRVRHDGMRVLYEPGAIVTHVEGGTAGTDPSAGHKRHQERNREIFVEKWADTLTAEHLPDTRIGIRLAADRLAGGHVLVIDHQVPTPDRDSGSVRMVGMIRSLQSVGCQVSFLPDNGAAPQPYTRALQEQGVEVLSEQQGLYEQLLALLPLVKAVLLSRPGVAPRWLAMVRELAPRATVIYDTVDLHWVRESRRFALNGRGGAGETKVTALRELELAMVRAADATLVVTDVERKTLLLEVPDARVLVVPNLHELAQVVPPPAGRRGIVFVGGFSHPPNTDAAVYLVETIMPEVWRTLPDVAVTIVGADAPLEVQSLRGPLVDVTGWIEDLDPVLHASRLLVAPLRYGAGMKGKVTHSLSMGLPVITTPSGAEGLEIGADAGLLVAEDPAEIAERIVEVYTDDALWRELSRSGQAAVARSCSPAVARHAFELLLTPTPGVPARSVLGQREHVRGE